MFNTGYSFPSNMDGSESGLIWEIDIPLLNNRYMLWDFTRLTLITFFFTDLLLLLATGGDWNFVLVATVYGGLIFIGLLVFASLLILRNRIRTMFILDDKGVGSKISRANSKLNKTTIVLGALIGSPTAVGAGLLASSNEETFFAWNGLHKVTVDRKRMVINIHNSWRALQRIYCYPENFEDVLNYVSLQVEPSIILYETSLSSI